MLNFRRYVLRIKRSFWQRIGNGNQVPEMAPDNWLNRD
nr:MAG TPA: hypothetical protein [Caudoviricetes sp.]